MSRLYIRLLLIRLYLGVVFIASVHDKGMMSDVLPMGWL